MQNFIDTETNAANAKQERTHQNLMPRKDVRLGDKSEDSHEFCHPKSDQANDAKQPEKIK